MVWNVYAWWFNGVERQRERKLYANLHEVLYKKGFTYQISFYGTLAEPYDGKHVQARIEVISNKDITESEITLLYEIFRYKPITKEYSLYILKDNRMIEAEVQ